MSLEVNSAALTPATSIKYDAAIVVPEKLNSIFNNNTKVSQKESDSQLSEQEIQPEKMTRKEANNWVKAYRKEHGCSKKEAQAAFESEFGYKVPSSMFAKALRSSLSSTMALLMFPFTIADGISHGKLGITDKLDHFVEEGNFNNKTKA